MEYIKNYIPVIKGKRPATKANMISITIHNTGNPSSTALNERNWLINPNNNRTASFHIVVDSKQAIECIPLDEVAYHSGKAEGNNTSIGIEICESGNYKQTEQNAIELVAKMLVERGWGVDRVKTHKSWSGKECPRIILPYWDNFIKRIQVEIDKILNSKNEVENKILKIGSKGQEVKELQENLIILGYDLKADGIYGNITAAIIGQLQEKYGLKPIDGIVGKDTYALIDRLLKEKKKEIEKVVSEIDYPTLKLNSTGEYVKTLQAKLNEFGYNLKVDGDYGLKTKSAVLDYQMKNNIKPYDGICGKLTWNSLLKNGHIIKKPTIETPTYKIIGLTHVLEIDPLRLYNDVCKKQGNLIKGDFVNGTFFGNYQGQFISIGTLVNNGKILAEQLPHDNVKRGTFIVYADGNVKVEMIDFISKYPYLKDIKFAISGFNMFPLNLKAEWFNPKEVGYETWRTVLGYNPTIKKAIIAVRPSSTAERGRDTLKNLGCIIGIGLDSGGSTNARFNGKTIRTTARRLHNIIRWD